MIGFEYYNPAKIIFGEGSEKKIKDLLESYNVKSLLLVYSGDFVKTLGIFDVIADAVGFEHHAFAVLDVAADGRLILLGERFPTELEILQQVVDGGGIVFEVFLVEDRRIVMRLRGLRADREEFLQAVGRFAVGFRGLGGRVFRVQRVRGFLADIVGARGENDAGGERCGGEETNGLHIRGLLSGKTLKITCAIKI